MSSPSDAERSGQSEQSSEQSGKSTSGASAGTAGASKAAPGTERIAKPGSAEDVDRSGKASSSSDADRSGKAATGSGTGRLETGEQSGPVGDAESSAGASSPPGTERIAKPGSGQDAERSGQSEQSPERSGKSISGASAGTIGEAKAAPGTERIAKPSAPRETDRVEKPTDERPAGETETAAEQTQQLPPVAPEGGTRPNPVGAKSAPEEERPTEHIEVPEDLGKSEAEQETPAAGDSSLVETGAELLPKPVRVADAPPPQPRPASSSRSERWSGPLRGHRRLLAAWISALVVLGVLIGVLIGSNGLQKLGTASPPSPIQLHPAIHPVDASAPVPSQRSLAAALSGPASNPALGNFAGQVLDARTGQQLWQQNGNQPMTPASTGKLFALSAALLEFDPQHRFTTKVVRGPTPGSVVLVGGGDPTLSTLPPGQQSVYTGAPSVDDLANQVRAATGGHVTQVFVDNSRYVGPQMAPGWDHSDIAGGSVAPIRPVMVNGGRSDPTAAEGTRTATPSLQAGQELARRIGAPTSAVSEGTAPQRAQPLGEVRSPTVRDMVESVLTHSDNVGAETLAREVAIRTGNEPSFAGGAKAVRDVLARHGFATNGLQMQDGSGLSQDDRVRPADIAAILEGASAPANDERTRRLRDLLPGLPVAGGTGTLADRYHDSQARGWVRAKTGTLSGANGLTGTALTQDGRLLVFAFLSNGPSSAQARPALDKVAEALRGCGCR